MQAVKVLTKGQITLPSKARKKLGIKEGDVLTMEEVQGGLVLKKGKTIFDYAGSLPNKGMSIAAIREKAIAKAVKDRA